MKYYGLAILVGILNVALNQACMKAGSQFVGSESDSYPFFWGAVAFAIGCASFGSLLTFYSTTGESFGKGVVVIGATSIVLGALYATALTGNRFNRVEWLLLGLIAAFYVVRALKLFGIKWW